MLTLQPVALAVDGVRLPAELGGPASATGVVVLARGSGSCRHDPRYRAVAEALHRAGVGTLLVDLLTDAEERADAEAGRQPDPALLTERLLAVVDWLAAQPGTGGRPLGLLGSGAAAAPALSAAARRGGLVRGVAVVPTGPSTGRGPAGSDPVLPDPVQPDPGLPVLRCAGLDEREGAAGVGDAVARWFPPVLGA